MKQKFTLLAAATFFAFGFSLRAQSVIADDTYLHCGTDQVMAQVFIDHPEIKADFEAREQLEEARDLFDFQNRYSSTQRHDNNSTQSNPTYIIPVVFHIIHEYGPENISDAQVLDAMRVLNLDYRKLNADTSVIRPAFLSIATDVSIEFRLANLDPNGNCTNGIDRVYSYQTFIGDDNSKLNPWPRNKYLNIWSTNVIGQSGSAAYAYLPGTAPSAATDGVISLDSYIGTIGTSTSSHGRTLTHEIGHFLNLSHLWGNTNNPGVACGNDGVTDTPVTKGWSSCPSSSASKVCSSTIEENVQNYMDYSYCSVMFTAGQKARMYSAITSAVGQRNSLWTSGNLTATGVSLSTTQNPCASIADFWPGKKILICDGGSVNFLDASFNGTTTGWLWSFPGGTPSSSTSQNPTITYNTPGLYNVTLTSTNAQGSDSQTKTGIVQVSNNTAQYSVWNYVESFETLSTFSADWIVDNPAGNAWTRSNQAAVTGIYGCRISNSSGAAGMVDAIISPSINMTAISGPVFTFKLAFARRLTANGDRLRVYTSTDCGQTWVQRYSKQGSSLATAATTNATFIPTANEWRNETVNITNVLTATNVRFKFEFLSDGGNNIYLDDINVFGATGINSPEIGINQFSVFPNPVQDNTVISFTSTKSQNVSLQIFDMTGREVMKLYAGNVSEGEHQFPLETAGTLGSGLYFVRLTSEEGGSITQKLLVQ